MTRTELRVWAKVHKKELIVSGIGILSILLVILGINHQDCLEELYPSLCEKADGGPIDDGATVTPLCSNITASVSSSYACDCVGLDSDNYPYTVSRHIRTLPKGWHASEDKIKMAQEYGISLHPGQTWVDEYTKCS